jgi:hypothetical protein
MKRHHPPLPALKTRSAGARCKKFMFSPQQNNKAHAARRVPHAALTADVGAHVKIYAQINVF